MVADKVTVYSRKQGTDKGYCWLSGGDGTYQISEAEGVDVGTKIILHLRDDCADFATAERVRSAVTKYSSFVSFPVACNGDRVNDVQALWLKDAAGITKEEHAALYRHIAAAYDEPAFHLVYKADAPIDIKSVFYVPSMNIEKMGLAKVEAGVHLYSRRVLIQHGSKDLLPEWLRFVRGVVDSEDLPLSISRENMQDVALLQKLKAVLTRRICRWLGEEAKRDPKGYLDFHGNYNLNLKEGVATDRANAAEIAKLLRYPTTALEEDGVTSFQEYVERMKEGQEAIYYIVAANRKVALGSPYYEAFKRGGYEVLLCYHDHDEVVLQNLARFADKEFKSIETVEPPAAAEAEAAKEEEGAAGKAERLSPEQEESLLEWLKATLGPRVKDVQATKRLVDSPAVITEHDTAVTRKLMQMAEFRALGITKPPAGYKLQVNLAHPLLVALDASRRERADLAALVAHQVLDNAVMSAGIMDDAREMLPRLSQLMQAALRPPSAADAAAPPADAAAPPTGA
jgi:TNF receptor-associated protein 1